MGFPQVDNGPMDLLSPWRRWARAGVAALALAALTAVPAPPRPATRWKRRSRAVSSRPDMGWPVGPVMRPASSAVARSP